MITKQEMGSVKVWDLKRFYELGFNLDDMPENATMPQRWAFDLGRRDREAELGYQADLNR